MEQTNSNENVHANGKDLDDIVNKNNMGGKKFHSETSLQHFVEDEETESPHVVKDPGVCTFLIIIFLNFQSYPIRLKLKRLIIARKMMYNERYKFYSTCNYRENKIGIVIYITKSRL